MHIVKLNEEAIALWGSAADKLIAVENILVCKDINTSHHIYLEADVFTMPPNHETTKVLIPHAFVLLIHYEKDETPVGYIKNYKNST